MMNEVQAQRMEAQGGWGADWILALGPVLHLPNDGRGGQVLNISITFNSFVRIEYQYVVIDDDLPEVAASLAPAVKITEAKVTDA